MALLDWPEVPRVGTAIFADDYIDYWADQFIALGLVYRGVTLMQFLANPARFTDPERNPEPLPLLGSQLRVQREVAELEREALERMDQREGEPLDLAWSGQRAERDVRDLPRRDGWIVERLRHHRYPRNLQANFNLKRWARR